MNKKYKEFIKATVDQEAEVRRTLIEKFGPPAFETQKGITLNERFWAAYYADQRTKIIFEPDERRFFDYDSDTGIFLPKSIDLIRDELAALVLAASKWAGHQQLAALTGERHLKGVIAHLRGRVEVREFFGEPDDLVHLGNCTLRFNPDDGSSTREAFSPDQRSRNRSPINYDPKAKCPDFKEKILGHLELDDRLLLQKIAGQCLLGRNLTQRLLILDGVGKASKSAFIRIIAGTVGPKNVYELRTKHLADRFEIGRMIGKTLLTGSDVPGHFLMEPGTYRLKSLVGGDQLEAELKGSNEHFYVYGDFNVMISANTRQHLTLHGDRGSWERRLTIVRYTQPFQGQRIFEIERGLLEAEASGILNWSLEGLEMLFQDYRKEGDIILSAAQKKRVSDLLSESDSLGFFIHDYVISDYTKPIDGNGEGPARYSVTTEEITDRYVDYCRFKGWDPLPVARIKKQLPDLIMSRFGVTQAHDIKRDGKDRRGFWNVRILPEAN
jgi:hypothetical protein